MERKEGKSAFGYVKLASAIVLSAALVAMLVLVAIQGTSAASLQGKGGNRAMKSSAELSLDSEIEQSALLLADNDSSSSNASGNSSAEENSSNQSAPNGAMPNGPMGKNGSGSNRPDTGSNGGSGSSQDNGSGNDSDSNSQNNSDDNSNSGNQNNSDNGDFWNRGNSGNNGNNGSNGNDFWNNNGQGNKGGAPSFNGGNAPDFGNGPAAPNGNAVGGKGVDGLTIAEAVLAIIMMLAGAAYALADTLQMRTAQSGRLRKAMKPSAIITGVLAVVAVVFTIIWAVGLLSISAFIMLALCLAFSFIAMPLLAKGVVEAYETKQEDDGMPVAPEGVQPVSVEATEVVDVPEDVPADKPAETEEPAAGETALD